MAGEEERRRRRRGVGAWCVRSKPCGREARGWPACNGAGGAGQLARRRRAGARVVDGWVEEEEKDGGAAWGGAQPRARLRDCEPCAGSDPPRGGSSALEDRG